MTLLVFNRIYIHPKKKLLLTQINLKLKQFITYLEISLWILKIFSKLVMFNKLLNNINLTKLFAWTRIALISCKILIFYAQSNHQLVLWLHSYQILLTHKTLKTWRSKLPKNAYMLSTPMAISWITECSILI